MRPGIADLEDVDTRMLALLVEDRRKMLDLRTKLSNKLTATLKGS